MAELLSLNKKTIEFRSDKIRLKDYPYSDKLQHIASKNRSRSLPRGASQGGVELCLIIGPLQNTGEWLTQCLIAALTLWSNLRSVRISAVY
ncbi:hypothetical protein J6590_094933, partial [Homalodisca vitripennis]